MEHDRVITVQEQRNQEQLVAGLAAADCYISKTYLINLSDNPVLDVDESYCKDPFLRLYHVDRFVFDKKENINDKLTSVFSALHELDSTAILLVCGDAEGISFHLGTYSANVNSALCGEVLEKGLQGNFPGSHLKSLKTSEIKALLDNVISDNSGLPKNISTVSVIPSMRDKDKDKFVQGIEKFIDTMQGKVYTAVFVAKPISKNDLEYRKRGLEEIASSLSPFVKTTLAYGENSSRAVTEGMCENFSHSVNQGITNTNGGNASTNESVTNGTNSGINLFGLSRGSQRSKTSGYSSGTNWSKAVSESVADTGGTSKNTSSTDTTGDSKTLTVEHVNKSIENLIKTIDMQLERIRDCESFGVWDCAAYFLSEKIQVSVMAANTYKALVAGDSSSVEDSYINVWDIRNSEREKVAKYLRYGLHPQILISEGKNNGYDSQTVTPGSFISGKELPLFMGTPQKSVSGLTVNSIAEFGRGVFTLDNNEITDSLPIGHIFHMGQQENTTVSLDTNSFTSHCFIAGSTGSGKSNTTYLLLNEFNKKNIPFLVIEPAKGEYKTEFGKLPGIHIYSTNPRFGQMLRLNPFWFDAENIHVLEHLDRLIEIFNACWEMYAAMPAILKAAAEQIYIRKGWDILNSIYIGEGKPKFPTFADLLETLPEIIKSSAYSSDTQGDYTGALVTRVASLANGISGQIFCSGSVIPEETLFDENTIVDLSRVGSSETKALIMGILVMKLTEYRAAQAVGSNSKLRHITVLEEAHNLLKRTSTSQGQDKANLLGKSVEMISNSIAEMRTCGEGFIIVDQSPTAVDISAIKNTNTKIIMRMPEKEDCETVGNAMALNDEQIKELAKLPTGVAAVIQNNWLETALVKIYRAPQDYKGENNPVDIAVLRELRGVIATQIIRQYFDERRFDIPALEEAVLKVNAPEDKKKEALDNAKSLIFELDSGRNVNLVAQWLLNFACCQSAFDIHEQYLRFVDFQAKTDEDYSQLEIWRNNVESSVLSIVDVDKSIAGFFVRNLIYAQTLKNTTVDYTSVYEMLYEKPEMKENKKAAVNTTSVEIPKQEVM